MSSPAESRVSQKYYEDVFDEIEATLANKGELSKDDLEQIVIQIDNLNM